MVSGHVWQFQFVAIQHLEVHIKVDNYKDYVIMSPDTGKYQSWRCTTSPEKDMYPASVTVVV